MIDSRLSFLVGLFLVSSALMLSCQAAEKPAPIKFPLPGKSGASIQLQKDTLVPVLTTASASNPICKKMPSVEKTAITAFPNNPVVKNGLLIKGEWKELWTVNTCGKIVNVPIIFTADGQGGAYYSISEPKQ